MHNDTNHPFSDGDTNVEITDLDHPTPHRTFQEFRFSPRVRIGIITLTIISIVLLLAFTSGSQLYALVHKPQPPHIKNDTSPSSITVKAVMNGVVYAVDPDRMVYALRASNGSLIWQSFTPTINWSTTMDGITYSATEENRVIVAQIKNANPLWVNHLPAPLAQLPVIVGNRIYIITDGNIIDALNITDGKLLWSLSLDTQAITQPPIIDGDFLFLDVDDNTLLTLRARDGKRLWKHAIPQATQMLAIAGNIIYVSDKTITALHPDTGTLAWSVHLTVTPVEAMVTTLDNIYIATFDNGVTALNGKSGARLWQHQLPALAYEPIIASNGLIYVHGSDNVMYILHAADGVLLPSSANSNILAFAVVDDTAYIVTLSNQVEAIDAGKLLWQRQLPSAPIRPVLVDNGVIYTGSATGTVYAIRANDSTLLWHYATQVQSQ